MEKTIEVRITTDATSNTFYVDTYEPECGEWMNIGKFLFSPDEHPEFNEAIGNEIYSWAALMIDEEEEEEE